MLYFAFFFFKKNIHTSNVALHGRNAPIVQISVLVILLTARAVYIVIVIYARCRYAHFVLVPIGHVVPIGERQ